jgi:SAM-dependent methyltransferase
VPRDGWGRVAMDSAAQDFWLEHLGLASRFNDWVFSCLEPHLGDKVLEVGCGSGNFTVLVAASGRDVTGYDIHAPYVEIARSRLLAYPRARVSCADATQMQVGDQYDTIMLLDVLEHIENDQAFLSHLRGALRPGGRLILKVPAYRWLFCKMDEAVGHYRRYDRTTLSAVLKAAGFDLVEHRPFNAPAIAGWFLNGKILGRTTPPAEQVAAFDRLVPAFRFVEQTGLLPFGVSLISVATPSCPTAS